MEEQDIRWVQRLANYSRTLSKLRQAIDIVSAKPDFVEAIDELLQEGVIQRFEYTHELAWKVMKDYAEYQGYTDVKGSRDAMRKAFEMGLIDDKRWMNSIADRNLTSHNYDDEVANEIFRNIVNIYYPLFDEFEQKMKSLEKSNF